MCGREGRGLGGVRSDGDLLLVACFPFHSAQEPLHLLACVCACALEQSNEVKSEKKW